MEGRVLGERIGKAGHPGSRGDISVMTLQRRFLNLCRRKEGSSEARGPPGLLTGRGGGQVDDLVVALYDLLVEYDEWENTFVLFSSDHGYSQGQSLQRDTDAERHTQTQR